LVEQRIENPRVTGSIPVQATKQEANHYLAMWLVFLFLEQEIL
jgi:hypothetical protein